jgi:hypothetical protein
MVVCHPERSEGSVVTDLRNNTTLKTVACDCLSTVQRFLVALGMTSQGYYNSNQDNAEH